MKKIFNFPYFYSAHKNAYPRTRLNHSNYKDIFKTMIQMEDEIASKRALSHDQYNQMLIHVNHCAYSIQTVCTRILIICEKCSIKINRR